MSAYKVLSEQVAQINDILNAISVLTWDARTQMPPGGVETRGQQIATLSSLAQERLTSGPLRDALESAEGEVAAADTVQQRTLQHVREAVDLYERIPPALTAELAGLKTVSQGVWEEARRRADFSLFAPYLERMVGLNRQLAGAIGYTEHPYDALLLQYESGMTTSRLQDLFETLKAGILPLLDTVRSSGREPRWDFLTQDFPEEEQRAFNLRIAELFGYDLSRGRLDTSAHPFEISFTRQDVRITTRYNRRYLPMSLFGTLHEVGHALYEQGVAPELTRSALTSDFLGLYAVGGASYGTHESQSRLWENLVGRSRMFWGRHFSELQSTFPEQLGGVDVDDFYRAVNRVSPSLIRVEADEVTYNLHIMLRVELETALLEGTLAVAELPEAWNAKVETYLGLIPPDAAAGVLQDIHWSAGLFGSFPTYTVGNVMASQFFEAAKSQVLGLTEALAAGDYAPLRTWLTENIYQHGRTYTPQELLERATGQNLNEDSYLKYLNEKYGDLYGL
jgi:carboxypeptidase Taq